MRYIARRGGTSRTARIDAHVRRNVCGVMCAIWHLTLGFEQRVGPLTDRREDPRADVVGVLSRAVAGREGRLPRTARVSIAALGASARACTLGGRATGPWESREVLMESSFRAARDGLQATLWPDGELRPVVDIARAALQLARPHAREVGLMPRWRRSSGCSPRATARRPTRGIRPRRHARAAQRPGPRVRDVRQALRTVPQFIHTEEDLLEHHSTVSGPGTAGEKHRPSPLPAAPQTPCRRRTASMAQRSPRLPGR